MCYVSKAYCEKANSKLKWEIEWCHPLQRRHGLKLLLNCMMPSKNTRMQGLGTSELIRCCTAFWRLLKISCECAFACPKCIAETQNFFLLSQSSFELSYSEKSGSVGTRGREIALLLLFFPILLSSLKESVPVSDVLRWSSVISPHDLFCLHYSAIGQCCAFWWKHIFTTTPRFQDQIIFYEPTKQKTQVTTTFLAEPQLKIKCC